MVVSLWFHLILWGLSSGKPTGCGKSPSSIVHSTINRQFSAAILNHYQLLEVASDNENDKPISTIIG